ncbi:MULTISPECIES: Gfo/Idh/MocA family oxidoreductase [unclassified Parabacteroides]|uniref:Gfo/Idh/MocA family protein n=1 Tax=unclassified Parabacteroides TaxID=2649774 RepID=UPI00247578C7|nr:MULTISPECIES: Gfo/Idh/MocA family oxidoreductase [unclassified Parabacteroides]
MFITAQNTTPPLRLGVAGISHGHLWEVISRVDRGDFVIVGVAEKDDELRANNGLRGKVDASLFYADLEEMLDKTKPEAVIVYESIFDHLRVVEACAPRGIHVMVEKPLAVSTAHAERMAELARKHRIHLLTNYETTWYNTNHEAYRLINEGVIGSITRINVYDGHQGPIEIGCGKEFLDWLTDPVLNGGGAVIDFGCYGANLATWLLNGQKPKSVYAVLNQQKPALYPKVDDDATIIVEYPNVTVQIMASWNWPMNRKDMHIYGSKGYIYQDTPTEMRIYAEKKEVKEIAPSLKAPYNDSFLYFRAIVRGDIKVKPTDLSSLENNLTVVSILEAAIRSSQTGKPILFD